MIFYSIQWQASYGNLSCYADKPASIWMTQIIKNLHSMTCCYGCYGYLHHWQHYNYTIIYITYTKARSYKHWRYSNKTTGGPGSVWVFICFFNFIILCIKNLPQIIKYNLLSFLYVFFMYLGVVLVWYNDIKTSWE